MRKQQAEILRVKLNDNLFGKELTQTREDIKAVKGVFNVLSFGGALNTVIVEHDGRMDTMSQVRRVKGVDRVLSN